MAIGFTNAKSVTADIFAFISVTYPAGSTLTCSDGTKTLTAKTTTGSNVFCVPYAATWTVTATNGTNKKSASAVITTEWQSVNVALSYILYVYNTGDACTSVSGGFTFTDTDGRGASTLQSSNIMIQSGWAATSYATTKSYINFTDYNKLYVKASGSTVKVEAISTSGSATVMVSGTGTLSASVSGLNGNYKIRLSVSSSGNSVNTGYVSQIYLE